MNEIRNGLRTKIIGACLLIGLGVLGIADSRRLSSMIQASIQRREILGADAYLMIVSALLLICGLLVLAVSVVDRGFISEKGASPQSRRYVHLGLIVTSYAMYTLAVPVLGYLLSSICFFPIIFFLFGVRPWLKGVLLGLGVALISYFFFIFLMRIPLPRGWFRLPF